MKMDDKLGVPVFYGGLHVIHGYLAMDSRSSHPALKNSVVFVAHFSTALPSGLPRWEQSTTDLQPCEAFMWGMSGVPRGSRIADPPNPLHRNDACNNRPYNI